MTFLESFLPHCKRKYFTTPGCRSQCLDRTCSLFCVCNIAPKVAGEVGSAQVGDHSLKQLGDTVIFFLLLLAHVFEHCCSPRWKKRSEYNERKLLKCKLFFSKCYHCMLKYTFTFIPLCLYCCWHSRTEMEKWELRRLFLCRETLLASGSLFL